MKVFTVVGVRKSGKTTVVTELVGAFRRMGLKVGTSKTVFCPGFSMDQAGSNTWRHREAGADFVCVKAKGETDLLMPGGNEQELYQMLSADVLILEGDYELLVPRVVCAHKEEEAVERCNEYTIALAGRLGSTLDSFLGCPAFDVRRRADEMARWLWRTLPETEFPVKKGEVPGAFGAFCQCGCHKAEKKEEEKLSNHDRDEPLKARPCHEGMHIFLTGEKGIGKSTLLKKLRRRLSEDYGYRETGYETRKFQTEGQDRGYYFHSLCPKNIWENDFPVTIRTGEKKMMPVCESFESLGVQTLKEVRSMNMDHHTVFIADEIGKAENRATLFQKEMFLCLDELPLVLGVLQKGKGVLAEAVACRPDVKIFEVTQKNRNELEKIIMEQLFPVEEIR